MIAGSYCRINFPYNQLSPCITGEGNNFPHNCFGWHKLNIVSVNCVANDSNTIGVLSRKATLDHLNHWRYAYPTPHKAGVGCRNPISKKATPDAESVFFVVRYTRHSMAWCATMQRSYNRRFAVFLSHHAAHNGTICGCCARLRPAIDAQNRISRRPIMVTLAGQPQGWPVSFLPGIPTPVNVTAPIECRNSSGDSLNLLEEAAAMATVPTQSHPK
ncbi:ash family protein, partial [Salmonella enterica subsp. diarizonae]